jgi:hypothetical protein
MKKELRRIFEPEKSETADLSPNTNWDIKSKRTRRGEGHTASLAEMRWAQIVIGKHERRHNFGDLTANGRTKSYFSMIRVL